MIATLFKKGLTENSRNNVVYVTNRCNGCGSTIAFKRVEFMRLRLSEES
ncbi:hypothetical protein [Methanosarcina barkeri]|nr:hypothetical protein [Methanosarcina barkeri]